MIDWKHAEPFGWNYMVHVSGIVCRTRFMRRVIPSVNYVNGYASVNLRHDNGNWQRVRLHKVVAETFLGPRPPGLEINHIDGDKLNCSVSNLEYVTHEENMNHFYALRGLRLDYKIKKGPGNKRKQT